MISFFVCLGLLILSFFTYGKYVERVFGPTDIKITCQPKSLFSIVVFREHAED